MLKVGQKVFVKRAGDMARYYENNKLPIPVEEHMVTKIGRKYFYLDNYLKDSAFHLDSMKIKTEYSVGYVAYESMQAIEDEKELKEKADLIADKLRYSSSIQRLDLEKVRKVYDILFKEVK